MEKKKRIIKSPEVRRAEIIAAADTLFRIKGYEITSVDDIVAAAGVAKGTFYYYFKSKEEILSALARQLVNKVADRVRDIAESDGIDAITKFFAIIAKQKDVQFTDSDLFNDIHRPQNKALHEKINVESVLIMGPILAPVIEQGKREGVFEVEDSLSTIQFILAGSDMLFGEGLFFWTAEEEIARMKAVLILIERALGATPGLFSPLLDTILGNDHEHSN